MSKTCINSWEASNIAIRIAAKAFEHVVAPIDGRINEYLRSAYHACFEDIIGTTPRLLAEHGIGKLADTISVLVPIENDNWQEQLKGNTDEFLAFVGYGPDFSFPAATVVLYASLCAERAPFRKQQHALKEEIASQLLGRSVKAAMKAWPEAAQFIANEFNLGDIAKPEMTKPLETLLAKYLPMLAPPQGV